MKDLGIDFSQLDQLPEETRNAILKEIRDKMDAAVQRSFVEKFDQYINQTTSQTTFRQFFEALPSTQMQDAFWRSNVAQLSARFVRALGNPSDKGKEEEIARLKSQLQDAQDELQKLRAEQRGFSSSSSQNNDSDDRRIRLNDRQIEDLMEKVTAVLKAKNAHRPETGISREQIAQAMANHKIIGYDIPVDSKHLNRPLERLLEENKLAKLGERRSTKYHLNTPPPAEPDLSSSSED